MICRDSIERDIQSIKEEMSSGYWHVEACRTGRGKCGKGCSARLAELEEDLQGTELELRNHQCEICTLFELSPLATEVLASDDMEVPDSVERSLLTLRNTWYDYESQKVDFDGPLLAAAQFIADCEMYKHHIYRR